MGSKVLAVIGARLNSSRLPGKQLLPLAGRPMIAHIVERLREVPEIDHLMLATTSDHYNAALCRWAESAAVDCLAFDGDVDDLVGRVDAAVRAQDPDILMYVCGDCPLVEPSTISTMLREMIARPEADTARLTVLRDGGHTIHEGFDFYRRNFWDGIVAASTEPFEREHIGAAVHHSKKLLPLNVAWVEDDPKFSTCDHRISIDTQADYDFMSRVYETWYETHEAQTLVSLKWVIDELQARDEWRTTNVHVRQKKVGEEGIVVRAIVGAGAKCGRGHVARTTVLLRAMQETQSADAQLLIVEDSPLEMDCQGIRNQRLKAKAVDSKAIEDFIRGSDILLVDVPSALGISFTDVSGVDAFKVAIDRPIEGLSADLLLVPSFYAADTDVKEPVYGWENYLVPRVTRRRTVANSIKSIIVVAGSNFDTEKLKVLVQQVASAVPPDVNVVWAGLDERARSLPELVAPNWAIWPPVPGLAHRLAEFDMAVAAYGVSFFECLNAGLPTVVFNAAQAITTAEWHALEHEGVALQVDSMNGIGAQLGRMLTDEGLRHELVKTALDKMPNDAGIGAATTIMQAYRNDKGEAG